MGNKHSNNFTESSIGFNNINFEEDLNINKINSNLPTQNGGSNIDDPLDIKHIFHKIDTQSGGGNIESTDTLGIADMFKNEPLQLGGGFNSDESLGLNEDFNAIFQTKSDNIQQNDNLNADTSPFISSEMYKFFMKGGARKSSKKTSKRILKQISETSATNSSEEMNDDGEESYVSSSAHSRAHKGSDIEQVSSVNTSDINFVTE